MPLTYLASSSKKNNRRTPSTSLSSSMWDKVREREIKGGLEEKEPYCHYHYSNNPPLMAYKAKDLRNELWVI